ncbi:MAG TPA: PaaI family thioesterase, partial [Archangium sp.]
MEATTPRIADLLRQVRQTGDYRLLTEVIPYTRFLGIGVENTTGEVLCRMRYAPMLIGNSSIPALHGGTL